MTSSSPNRTKAFISYSHNDAKHLKRLHVHLAEYERNKLVDSWDDTKLMPGAIWQEEIEKAIKSAKVAVLLISADFLASPFITENELPSLLAAAKSEGTVILPVILSPCAFEYTKLSQFQAINTPARPLSNMTIHQKEDLWAKVAKTIRDTINLHEFESALLNVGQTKTATKKRITQGELTRVQNGKQITAEQRYSPILKGKRGEVTEYLGEAPHIRNFYGREQELAKLKHWIVNDKCQVVAVLGIGGMGKTLLAAALTNQIKDEFSYIIWHSLQNMPPIEYLLESCIKFLSNQKQIDLPEDLDDQIGLLIKYLREYRSLIVLDNVESVLPSGSGSRAGQYDYGYYGYARLFELVGETQHQSCLLLTSREKPREVSRLEGMTVRSLLLSGVGQAEGKEILKDQGLFGSNETWSDLINLYSGNPLALKLVSELIREIFSGNISGFLKGGESVMGDIGRLLEQQFHRLSEQEQEIMYWLAIGRVAMSLDDLQKSIVQPVPRRTLLEVISSLRRRSMIETVSSANFTLQPVIMEYVADDFIEKVSTEISTEFFQVCERYALIRPQAKDYVRDSQIRLILDPVVQRLYGNFGKGEIERKLKEVLARLREKHPLTPGYLGGNVLNILIHLGCDLCGYDFSHITLWQAC